MSRVRHVDIHATPPETLIVVRAYPPTENALNRAAGFIFKGES